MRVIVCTLQYLISILPTNSGLIVECVPPDDGNMKLAHWSLIVIFGGVVKICCTKCNS